MNALVMPILVPLLAGALLVLLPGPRLRTLVAVSAATATLIASTAVAWHTLSEGASEVLVVQMGGWPAPYGISLVADGLTGIMLLLSSITGLLTVLFASSSLRLQPTRGTSPTLNRAREALGAPALLQFLFMGVNMSFLTGDLFNLFVSFEVMLIASYGLLLIGGEVPQLREGLKYVVINLVISALFVVAGGLAYGLFGTLNMADIARLLTHTVSESGPDARVTLVVWLFTLVFATKAALFPLGFWLPRSYPTPPAAISAFFAAVLTKVGAYALLRAFTLMFPSETGVQHVVLLFAGITLLVGGFGAIAQGRWRSLLSFTTVASVGYVVAGSMTLSEAGLSATLYYLVSSVLVLFALFLIAGLAERIEGASFQAEGHLSRYPTLAFGFFISALVLAGLPPMSGFIGKFGLIQALFAQGGALAVSVAGVAVVTSLLLLYALTRVWRGYFWGEDDAVHSVALPLGMTGPTAAAVALLVVVTLLAGPLYRTTGRVAAQLLDNGHYIRAVFPPQPLEVENKVEEVETHD